MDDSFTYREKKWACPGFFLRRLRRNRNPRADQLIESQSSNPNRHTTRPLDFFFTLIHLFYRCFRGGHSSRGRKEGQGERAKTQKSMVEHPDDLLFRFRIRFFPPSREWTCLSPARDDI